MMRVCMDRSRSSVARTTELTEPISSYNDLERNYTPEPARNRAKPISKRTGRQSPFSSTVVPSLVPIQDIDLGD
jgi:hypothetical protein